MAAVVRRQVDEAAEDKFLADDRKARATTPGKLATEKRAAADRTLTASLTATGRAGGTTPGGKSQAARAEESAGTVLGLIERGTQQNQAATDPSAPQTHAVSGHGPGTDQESRLLHGRRADELAADRRAGKPADYTTVGNDPSNTSGAFSSTQGMLHAVSEGFAQANMVSAHAADVERADRSKGVKDSSGVDSGRFVTNVTGRDAHESLGYNLSVDGVHGQTTGLGLAADEVEQRRKLIKRDDGMKQARIVLDPAYVDGRRAGWNLQTAYANADPASPQFATPAMAGASPDVLKMEADARVKDVATAERAVQDARDALDAYRRDLPLARQAVTRIEEALAGAAVPPEATRAATEKRLTKLADELDGAENPGGGGWFEDDAGPAEPVDEAEVERLQALVATYEGYVKYWTNQDRLAAERSRLVEVEAREAGLLAAVPAAEQRVMAAKQRAADAARAYADVKPAAGPARDPDEGASALGAGGYNPATGLWDGERPAKLSSLKGTDESGDSLTAHHLYPWNKIRGDLNKALSGRDRGALERLFAFGSASVDDSFWSELAKDPAVRPYSFSEQLNLAVRQVCWAPANVFMGPLGSKRGDDPGEELDQAFSKRGLMTPASAVAELTAATGGIGATPAQLKADITGKFLAKVGKAAESELSETQRTELAAKVKLAQGRQRLAALLAERTRDAQGGSPRAYDPAEWATNADGKRVRAGQVASAHVKEVPPDLVKLRDEIVTLGAKVASLGREIKQFGEQVDELAELLDS
jgi:hypothetical protein